MSIKSFFGGLFGKAKTVQTVANKGSAFARLVIHETEHLEAKGKLIALDAAIAAGKGANEALLKEAARIHAAQDSLEADRNKIMALL